MRGRCGRWERRPREPVLLGLAGSSHATRMHDGHEGRGAWMAHEYVQWPQVNM